MSDLKKIATIVIRGFAVSFLTSSLVETAIVVSAKFLEESRFLSKGAVAVEGRILLIISLLIAGLSLYKWSRSLAQYLVQGLSEKPEEITSKNANNAVEDEAER